MAILALCPGNLSICLRVYELLFMTSHVEDDTDEWNWA
jgi:hypothetical protein